MLVYSRNFIFSLRNCWKASNLVQGYGSVDRRILENIWQKLKSFNLLTPIRGQRGGNNLRTTRSIPRTYDIAAREFRRPKISSTGVNHSNLLNIQIAAREFKITVPPKTSKFLKTKLHVAHLNVRSVKERNHLIQLRELVREKNYDVLAISESWLNSTTTNAEVEIAGYKLIRLDRLKKKGGGVCVYTRSSLKIKRLKEMSVTSETGFQQLWVQIQLKKLKSIMLCVAYRPEYCPVSCFVDDFMDKYSQALTHGKNIIVAADLNCDMLKPHSPEATALQDLCDSVNLTQLIKEPTRVTATSSTLIDVIMTSSTDLVERSGVLQSHISDHYLVDVLLKLKIPKPPPSYVKVRSYKNYDSQRFVSDLERVPWNEVTLDDDASDMVDRFNARFLEVLDGHAPIKVVKVKHRRCPFVTEEIKELMRDRDRFLKIARCTGLPVDWEIYRDSRQVVKTRLRKAEQEYINKEMERCRNTSSKWKLIRNCLPRKETTQLVYMRDIKEIVEEFNEFFVSVGAKASEAAKALISCYDLSPPIDLTGEHYIPDEDKFEFRAASTHEIRKAVMSFSSNKAPGHDKVAMSVIKDALPSILVVLTDIVNRSLLSSVFPTAWKMSEVIPLLKDKDGDHEIANNNRPVSLLPAVSKICERIALNQLMEYMTNKKCLSEHQSGNKKLHSCETLNVFITDRALEAMDAKRITVVILLDLSKAFDSIDHLNLLTKLKALGVSQASLDWFKSYLSGRLQCVRIGTETSGLQSISHGVPQGSILGPALFTIYLNNIPSMPDVCSLESYVDDSKLYISFPVAEASDMVQQINADLQKVASWCCYNSLLINPDKTKLLVLGTRQMLKRLPDDFQVTLLGKKVTPSSSARDLGLQVDSTLSYDEHVTQTVSSCIGCLCQINRVKHLFDARTLERIINALVFSKLYFCSPVWSNTSKKNVSKVQKVQNFAARIITGTLKFDHITPTLHELGWLPVHSYLKYTLGVLAFKCVKGLAPKYLCDKFKTRASVHGRNTRYKDTLDIPSFKSASGQRTFSYRAVELWNSLPRSLTDITDIAIFKQELKEFLF